MFFKDSTNHRIKINKEIVFSCRPFPNILKCRDHREDLPTIWKTILLQTKFWRFQLVRTASKFFRNITGTQSGPDTVDESRFFMTLLFILGVTEILCSLRLDLEGKTGKESSRLEFLQNFLANNFALSDAEDNISRQLNTEGTTDLPLLRTLLENCQKSKSQVFEKWWTLLAASRTLLQQILACLILTWDSEDLFA